MSGPGPGRRRGIEVAQAVDSEDKEPSWLERRRETLRRRWALVALLRDTSPTLVAVAVIVAAAAGISPVAVMLAGGSLASRIEIALSGGVSQSELDAILRAFGLVIAAFLVGEILVPLQNRVRWLVTKRVDGAARHRVMTAALAGTDMSRLHGQEFLDAMGLARGLIRWSATPGGGAAGIIGVCRDYLSGIAAAVVLATFQPVIALAAVAVALVLRVRWRRATLEIIEVWMKSTSDRREGWYFAELGLGRVAANEMRLFGLGQWLRSRINKAGLRAWTPTWRQRTIGMGWTTLIQLILVGGVAIAGLVWAARASVSGSLDVGELVVFVPALFAVLGAGRYFNDDTAVEYGTVVLPAIETLERLAASTLEQETGRVAPRTDRPPTVEMRRVSFRYPGGDADILADVDLKIPGGTSAALVGVNGAGKTTLIRLLCGLYPPTGGAVLVDGVDLREVDLPTWHRLLAPMFQESLRLPATVADNVGIGTVERIDDKGAVRSSLDEAGALRFTRRLPQEEQSVLATRYADGSDLSGGQWQRLHLARALFAIHNGARVLLLDEPTSNLDTMSEERLVHRLLDQTSGTATTLLVTHRLALARRADQIFVLDHGRVVERGTHDELLEQGGRYARAFSMQASLYPLEDTDV